MGHELGELEEICHSLSDDAIRSRSGGAGPGKTVFLTKREANTILRSLPDIPALVRLRKKIKG